MVCKNCGKEIEWYRGRPKEYCSKCRIIATKIVKKEYYIKHREERLAYSNNYYKKKQL